MKLEINEKRLSRTRVMSSPLASGIYFTHRQRSFLFIFFCFSLLPSSLFQPQLISSYKPMKKKLSLCLTPVLPTSVRASVNHSTTHPINHPFIPFPSFTAATAAAAPYPLTSSRVSLLFLLFFLVV